MKRSLFGICMGAFLASTGAAQERPATTSPVAASGPTGPVCNYAKATAESDLRVTASALQPDGSCRIDGIIGTEIGVEFLLPRQGGWNGRLIAVGVGGQAGAIPDRELERLAARGYAVMANDSGHKAADKHWLLGDRERAANYAGLANHRMALVGSRLVNAYYDRAPSHRFFIGCSGGGRQALTEVQRYPGDFDGVIAGAPGVNTPEMSARRMWEMQQHSRFGNLMTAETWRFVARSAVAACDDLDGVRDGILGDPFRCKFDPASLLCSNARRSPCLTPAQLMAVRRIYAPLRDENGREIDDGLLPGTPVSPVQLPEPLTPGPSYLAVVLFGDGVHRDANWDARRFRIADDLPAIDHVMNLHADDPDIDRFRAEGGKLILYQGLADPLVSARSTINYYEALHRRYGGSVRDFTRLFLVAGMEHCAGGNVPDHFGGSGSDGTLLDPAHDMLSALELWVDKGRPPSAIIATQTKVQVRSRPICAYPSAPHFRGGLPDDASSFDCTGTVVVQ